MQKQTLSLVHCNGGQRGRHRWVSGIGPVYNELGKWAGEKFLRKKWTFFRRSLIIYIFFYQKDFHQIFTKIFVHHNFWEHFFSEFSQILFSTKNIVASLSYLTICSMKKKWPFFMSSNCLESKIKSSQKSFRFSTILKKLMGFEKWKFLGLEK